MKQKYYVNRQAQPNGDHEVHKEGCGWMPLGDNKKELGEFNSCEAAIVRAKESYDQVNGCYYCCYACHTR